MKAMTSLLAALMAGTLLLPVAAAAHDQWILPSSTQVQVSSNPQRPTYVTFDAASSNQLFEFNHNPLRFETVSVTGPNGQAVEVENLFRGKLRASFDLKVEAPGTYRIAVVTDTVTASYRADGELKRFSGTYADFLTQVPHDAPELAVMRNQRRNETFVTAGAPSEIVLTGVGMELVPLQPVTDLVVGEAARFRVVVDGKPAANASVKVVPGGARFRGELGDKTYKADANGEFSAEFELSGMYWISTSYPPRPEDDDDDHGPAAPASAPPAAAAPANAAPAQGGRPSPSGPVTPGHRYSYIGTFEVAPF